MHHSPGGFTSFVVEVANHGPSTASNVVIRITIPEGGAIPQGIGFDGGWGRLQHRVTCRLHGSFPELFTAGQEENLFFAILPVGVSTVMATVSADEADPNPQNNSAALRESTKPFDLQIQSFDVSPDPVAVRRSHTYHVVAQNNGPNKAPDAAAHAVCCRRTLLLYRRQPVEGPSSTPAATSRSDLGDAGPAGTTANITIVVTPTIAGTITSTVNVTDANDDVFDSCLRITRRRSQ